MADINTAETYVDENGNVYELNKPLVLNQNDALHVVNQPSGISPQAMGIIDGTGTQIANQNKKHVCDTTIYIERAVAYAKAMGGQLVLAVRNAIRAIMKALGINPGSNGIIEFLKKVKEYADEFTEWMKEIQNDINAFLTGVQKIQALIAYILSLPGELIKYFLGCIKEAYAELSAAFLQVISDVGSEASDESKQLTDSLKSAYSSVTKSVGAAVKTATMVTTLPVTTAATLLSPGNSTVAQQQAAAKEAGILFDPYNKSQTFNKP